MTQSLQKKPRKKTSEGQQANKDAPTSKIYNEVTSGGMFYSLTNGIRGIFSSTRSGASSNDNGVQAGNAGHGNGIRGIFSSTRARASINGVPAGNAGAGHGKRKKGQ